MRHQCENEILIYGVNLLRAIILVFCILSDGSETDML